MPDNDYAFVDRKCPACAGTGKIPLGRMCACCHGTGLIGDYEEVPSIEYDGPSAFTYRLRLTRETRKVSMSELAAQLGTSVVELSDIERGKIEPIGALKEQIAKWVYDATNPR